MIKAKQLLVEGHDDLYAVVGLMQHHVEWPDDKNLRPVHIEPCNGVESLLDPTFIATKLKESGLKTLGIMLDADGEGGDGSRWIRVRQLCFASFPTLPLELPAGGMVVENDEGLRLGVWIMPDNRSRGMLETLMAFLVPAEAQPLWNHAIHAFDRAVELGAPCKQVHFDKARIHTWLAWQDPPGQQFGTALVKRILDPYAAAAEPFVVWFRHLYQF